MPLAPEIRKIPEIIGKFNRAGLTKELIGALIKGETGRDLVEDARRLAAEFGGDQLVNVNGIENIPKNSGCLVVFNHPNIDVLLPAILSLIVKVHDEDGPTPTILMGAEIPLLGKFNATRPLPGSISFINRFHRLYPKNIISVPISTTHRDYHSNRFMAAQKAVAALRQGNMVLVAPEGHVEMNNTISPVNTFHSGSGSLSVIASRVGAPTVPVGIWETKRDGLIHVNTGEPFIVSTGNKNGAVSELMFRIAQTMPKELRGPFEQS